PRAALRPRAPRRGAARRGEPDPAHHRRPGRRGARHAPPDLGGAVLQGPEARGEAPCAGFRRGAYPEIPRLARADPHGNQKSGGRWLVGRSLSYVDLSAFQVVEGLRYAFPHAMARHEADVPRLVALHDRVAERPRIAAYLRSKRRIAFNQQGIFRRYPELDEPAPKPTRRRR